MRKIALIFSLSLAVIFLSGHYFIYKSVIKSHKKEFKRFIRSNFAKIELIEIDPSELYANNSRITWLDENKEICLNGVMYDILCITPGEKSVKLYVVDDRHEKDLMNRYHNQFNTIHENGASGKKNNTLLKELLSFKYLTTAPYKLVFFHTDFSPIHESLSKTSSGYLTVHSPPPNA
jgi:hypothetical protein